MKKTIIILAVILTLVGIVVGGEAILTRVTYEPVIPTNKTMETLTFDCDGKLMTVEKHEPDGEWDSDDVEYLVRTKCDKTVTNIQKDGNYWRKNKDGIMSFNETKLILTEQEDIEQPTTIYYCSTNPTRNETCVCLSESKITCYYEVCGESPYGRCTNGEWIEVN